jgi:hypothetical protein
MACNITITGVICGMEAILERCAGLDVHQETVVACVLYGDHLRFKPDLYAQFGSVK